MTRTSVGETIAWVGGAIVVVDDGTLCVVGAVAVFALEPHPASAIESIARPIGIETPTRCFMGSAPSVTDNRAIV